MIGVNIHKVVVGPWPMNAYVLIESERKLGSDLIGGDVLFPGGPGHTDTPEDFQQVLETVAQKLFELPDETVVHPGRGESVTIGQAKSEYQKFAARGTSADLWQRDMGITPLHDPVILRSVATKNLAGIS